MALHPEEAIANHRVLDMQHGIAYRDTVYVLGETRLTVHTERFVSMTQSHGAVIRMVLTANAPCRVQLIGLMDGDVTNLVCTDDPRVGSGLKGRALSSPVISRGENACAMVQVTGHTRLAEACGMKLLVEPGMPAEENVTALRAELAYTFKLQPGQSVCMNKFVSYFDGGEVDAEELLRRAME